MENKKPSLYVISKGVAEQKERWYLGSQLAFKCYRGMEESGQIEPYSDAIHNYIFEIHNHCCTPNALSAATLRMLRLFASNVDATVGGWAVPYSLHAEGAELGNYYYSVTDPIGSSLPPYSLIPHGTASSGGFTMSFSWLKEKDGAVVYWLQKPGGKIFLERGNKIDEYDIEGTPSVFLKKAKQIIGRDIEILIGDQPLNAITSVTKINSQKENMLAVSDGNAVGFVQVQSSRTPWSVTGTLSRGQLLGDEKKNSDNT